MKAFKQHDEFVVFIVFIVYTRFFYKKHAAEIR